MLHNHWYEVLIDIGCDGPVAKRSVACSAFCWHCSVLCRLSSHSTGGSCICRCSRSGIAACCGPSAIKATTYFILDGVAIRSHWGCVQNCGAFTRPAAPPCTASHSRPHLRSAAAAYAHPAVRGFAAVGSKSTGRLSFTPAKAAQHTTETAGSSVRLPGFCLLELLGSHFGSSWTTTTNGSFVFLTFCSHVEPAHNTTKQATRPRTRGTLATLQCYALQDSSKHLMRSIAG